MNFVKSSILLTVLLGFVFEAPAQASLNLSMISNFLYDRQEIKQAERWTAYDGFILGRPRVQLKAQKFGYNANTWWLENNLYLSQGSFSNAHYESLPSIGTSVGGARRWGFSSFLFFVGVQYNNHDMGNYQVANTSLNLRVYGSSQQSTRFNILVGQKSFSGPGFTEEFRFAPVVGLEGCVYLFNQIGITATTYQFSKNQGLTGDRLDLELFAEYGAFRIFLQNFRERINVPVAAQNQIPSETVGLLTGLGFYF